MDVINMLIVGFAIYGVFAAVTNFSESRKKDVSLFKKQLATFREKNPDVLVACAGPGVCRHHVIYQAVGGRTVFQFLESHREAKRFAARLRGEGTRAAISWLGPSQTLEDPWKDKSL